MTQPGGLPIMLPFTLRAKMTNQCKCPECGASHDVNNQAVKQITNEETIKLFRASYLQYKLVSEIVYGAGAFESQVHYSQVAGQQLLIAILRKYILQKKEYVFLPKVVEACIALLPETYSHAGYQDHVLSATSFLSGKNGSTGIQFFINSETDSRTINDVVIDYLYGLLLHADPVRAERAIDGGPLNTLLSSVDWLRNADTVVSEVNLLVERAILALDGKLEDMNDLPKLVQTVFWDE